MTNQRSVDTCATCGGRKTPGTTTFTVDLGFGVVVVRGVPATVCSQCGADWIDDRIAAKLECIVQNARERRDVVEVTTLSAGAVAEAGGEYKPAE